MRTFIYVFLLVAAPAGVMGQTASDISSPQKRMATLDLVRTLLTVKAVDGDAQAIEERNPFNPRQPIVNQEIETPQATIVGLGDREILSNVAASVTPSGTMKLGDTLILLFGQKKLKVGDSIPIVFQGSTYDVYISGIDRTTFTLRLNKEEITRPIKPVNKP
ncbi:MAG: hypothetical protein K0R17_1426 [Rariglobus sp.]|jgi:hypothetical protein|nr:hypothetical protein [Rariglobus sp.]